MARQEMPIFTKTFELLAWLIPATNSFPRAYRYTVTQRMLHVAFELRERLEVANMRKGAARKEQLALADEALAQLRFYLRLSVRLHCFSQGQYKHVSQIVVEIGRLLGGWQKVTIV
ncbi:MAG TPA: diversity-generating retroelement protein Avd [Anaerolineae bacterium]|nr:diversity-generating retroelement protein Avd [Anaerolineae bacterium]